jgi:hypothetical protein
MTSPAMTTGKDHIPARASAHRPGNTSIRVSRGNFARDNAIAAVSLISTALKVKRSSALHSPIPRLLRETRFSLELR